ncbi:HAD family hydrolase [Bacillus sp. AK128]
MDDTLYTEHEYVMSGFYKVATELSKHCDIKTSFIYDLIIQEWKKNGRGRIFNSVCDSLGILTNISNLVQIYREHRPTLSLYEDANILLKHLKLTNVKIGLVTDGNSKMQWSKIKALELENVFDCIIVTGDLGDEHWKPAETPYRKAVECLGLEFSDCVYIGDNPNKDFITARKLGMKTIRIIRPIGDHMETRLEPHYEADRIIYSLEELMP